MVGPEPCILKGSDDCNGWLMVDLDFVMEQTDGNGWDKAVTGWSVGFGDCNGWLLVDLDFVTEQTDGNGWDKAATGWTVGFGERFAGGFFLVMT